MHIADSRWTKKVMDWLPRICKKSKGRVSGGRRNRVIPRFMMKYRERWKGMGKTLSCSGLAMAPAADEDGGGCLFLISALT